MQHESLRPYVATGDELYRVLQAERAVLLSQMGWRMVACIALLAVGLIAPGALGKTALCLAVLAAMAWTWTMVEVVVGRWFMHAITLHDVIRPYEYPPAEVSMAHWIDPPTEEQP